MIVLFLEADEECPDRLAQIFSLYMATKTDNYPLVFSSSAPLKLARVNSSSNFNVIGKTELKNKK
jgi:hypothetical protein